MKPPVNRKQVYKRGQRIKRRMGAGGYAVNPSRRGVMAGINKNGSVTAHGCDSDLDCMNGKCINGRCSWKGRRNWGGGNYPCPPYMPCCDGSC
jgi:hypothetical protein